MNSFDKFTDICGIDSRYLTEIAEYFLWYHCRATGQKAAKIEVILEYFKVAEKKAPSYQEIEKSFLENTRCIEQGSDLSLFRIKQDICKKYYDTEFLQLVFNSKLEIFMVEENEDGSFNYKTLNHQQKNSVLRELIEDEYEVVFNNDKIQSGRIDSYNSNIQKSQNSHINIETYCHGNIQQNTYNALVGIAGSQGNITVTNNAKVAGILNEYSSQKLNDIAQELTTLLDYFEQNTPSIPEAVQRVNTAKENIPELNDAQIIEATIVNQPTLSQRMLSATMAATMESIKALLPPLGVAIEAVKAYQNP